VLITSNPATKTVTQKVGGYCSTMFAKGPNLPTTAQGPCGTILILNEASGKRVGWTIWIWGAIFYGGLGLWRWHGFRMQ
jgi:hypothetical protein